MLLVLVSSSLLSSFCMFSWLLPHLIGKISCLCYVLLRHYILWDCLHPCTHRTVTTPYGNVSFPGNFNPMGIDSLQGITVTCHPSYTMVTEMSGPATGAPYLFTSSTLNCGRWVTVYLTLTNEWNWKEVISNGNKVLEKNV